MKNANLTKSYFKWLVFFNLPGLLISILLIWPALVDVIPLLGLVASLLGFFWINIPARWLGLAQILGQLHFDIENFEPKTSFGWSSIALFWALVAALMTAFTTLVCRRLHREKILQPRPDRDEKNLARLGESLSNH